MKNQKLALLILLFSVCFNGSLWASESPVYSASPSQNLKDTLFKKVHFYRDRAAISRRVSDSLSPYYFEKLLRRFLSEKPKLSRAEGLALLYGGLEHEGYQDPKLAQLELAMDSLNSEELAPALKLVAEECLALFPLHLRSWMELWQISYNQSDTVLNDIIGQRLNCLFIAMQTSGNGQKQAQPQLALSKTAVEYYIDYHAAGAGLKFVKETSDDRGNTLLLYQNGSIFTERFIIPKPSLRDSLSFSVYVSFTVGKDGEIKEVKWEKTECREYPLERLNHRELKKLEEEAVRVVRSMDKLEVPQQKTRFTQAIKSRLPADWFLMPPGSK